MWHECKHDDDVRISDDINEEQLRPGHNIIHFTYVVNFTYRPQPQRFPSGFT